jgi:hypothetical protein
MTMSDLMSVIRIIIWSALIAATLVWLIGPLRHESKQLPRQPLAHESRIG